MTFDEIMRHLVKEGYLITDKPVGDGVYTASPGRFGWSGAAREAARIEARGQFASLGRTGEGGLRWSLGSRTAGVVLVASSLPAIRQAQNTTRDLLALKMSDPLPYSVGGCCRKMLKWVVTWQGETRIQAVQRRAEDLRYTTEEEEGQYQYHDCEPGEYDRLTMLDASRYYCTMLCRLPSLRCYLSPDGGLIWQPMTLNERSKWYQMQDAMRRDKGIGNSVWGVMLGGTRLKEVAKGEYKELRGGIRSSWSSARTPGKPYKVTITLPPGPFRTSAILLARTGAEMCAQASEEVGSVYSTVDSISAPDASRVPVWDFYGIPYKVQARGDRERDGYPSHIVRLRSWRIGPKHTKPYAMCFGDRPVAISADFRCTSEPKPVPRHRFERLYHQEWL